MLMFSHSPFSHCIPLIHMVVTYAVYVSFVHIANDER